MQSLPPDPCARLLDLCSGSGVAALVAASDYTKHAWSLDVAESSAHCAEFNRSLNGIPNATVARGDLYDPVRGQTFDRIVANPPYMPSLRPAQLYAYGGELGDDITRRIVEDLPNYLEPGGRFYCVTAGPDRKGEGFERRIRSWLAGAGPDFHIFLFERRVIDPDFIAYQQSARSLGGIEQVDEWKALFEKHQVEGLFYGTVVIERRSGPEGCYRETPQGPPAGNRRNRVAARMGDGRGRRCNRRPDTRLAAARRFEPGLAGNAPVERR